MRPRPNLEQRLVGFACAVVLEPLAVAGTLHSAAFREIPWTLSYPVIALAAEIGGVEPALLACGIAVTGIFHFLLSQRGLPDHIVWEQNAAFGVAALFLVYLIRQRKRTATALSASETHYRSVAETASDVIVTIDERSSILSINPAVKGMFGYEPEELIGRPLTVLMPERLRGQHVAAVSRFLKNGERKVPWSGVQLPGLRSDGEEIPLEISFATYKTGQRQQFTGFIRDVSERTKTQAALLESEKLAAVGRLMSSIAHEINNPLESVTNLLYLVRNSVDPEEAAAYLQSAEQELRRVAVIANQTLQFHKHSNRPEAVEAGRLIAAVLALYQGKLVNGGITVQTLVRTRAPGYFVEGEIRQVLSNLVGNAIHATPRGGRILARSRSGSDWKTGTRGIVLTIADTGSGMDEATLRRIFEPFYSTKGDGGAGLGLWICGQLIDKNGGRLRVRSSQRSGHSGTVFTLFLPAAVQAETVGAARQVRASRSMAV